MNKWIPGCSLRRTHKRDFAPVDRFRWNSRNPCFSFFYFFMCIFCFYTSSAVTKYLFWECRETWHTREWPHVPELLYRHYAFFLLRDTRFLQTFFHSRCFDLFDACFVLLFTHTSDAPCEIHVLDFIINFFKHLFESRLFGEFSKKKKKWKSITDEPSKFCGKTISFRKSNSSRNINVKLSACHSEN